MGSTTENSDPYLYPGTSVLKNLRGLTDPELLARFEARRTHRRIAELIDTPCCRRIRRRAPKGDPSAYFPRRVRMGGRVSDREHLEGRPSFWIGYFP